MGYLRGGLISKTAFLLILLFIGSARSSPQLTIGDAPKLLPERLDTYQAVTPVRMPSHDIFESVNPDEVGAVSNGERMYRDADGSTFNLHLILTKTDTGAYALLTRFAD